MNKFRLTIKLVAIATFLLAFASMTQAQAVRTWVSGVGDDANPCSRTAPCKTFAGAISKTATTGEIDCLDPGSYGALTITKSITVNGTHGAGFGGVTASLVNGFIINDGTGNAVVILRHLSFNGVGNGLNGIRFLAGKALIVEDCNIANFPVSGATQGRGIDVNLAADGKNVVVRNTNIENCAVGIRFTTSSGIVQGTLENVRIEQPGTATGSGVEVQSGAIVTVRDSYITRYQTGINVTGASPAAAVLLDSVVFNTTTGIAAGSTTFRAAGSSIMFNTTGVSLAGGTFRSGCDNFIENNSTNVSGGGITNACVQ